MYTTNYINYIVMDITLQWCYVPVTTMLIWIYVWGHYLSLRSLDNFNLLAGLIFFLL